MYVNLLIIKPTTMNEMQSLRILSHGRIDDLSAGFKLRHSIPFSVYVRPKEMTLDHDMVIQAKCICDENVSALPVALNDWTPAAIVEIAPNAIDLSEYEVYWGAGNPQN